MRRYFVKKKTLVPISSKIITVLGSGSQINYRLKYNLSLSPRIQNKFRNYNYDFYWKTLKMNWLLASDSNIIIKLKFVILYVLYLTPLKK